MKKAFQSNGARRDVEIVLIINHTKLKAKLVKNDEESHLHCLREDVKVLTMYKLNMIVPNL